MEEGGTPEPGYPHTYRRETVTRRAYRDPGGWWWTALALVPLTLGGLTTVVKDDGIESDLRTRSVAALKKAEFEGVTVSFDGRDATVRVAPRGKVTKVELEQARDLVADVGGVRTARVDDDGVVAVAPEPTKEPTSGPTSRPPEPPTPCLPVPVRRKIEQYLGDDKVTFGEGGVLPDRRSRVQIARVGRLLARCRKLDVVVTGHTDDLGADGPLSLRRARAVRSLLIRANAAPGSITAIGRRDRDPRATNRTREGRARNRYADIEIRQEAR